MSHTACVVVLVTAPDRSSAERLATALVDERLAACVNIVGPIQSVYLWDGRRQQDEELLLLIKSRAELFGELRARVLELHSYDTPEVIQVPITDGSAAYLDWILAATRRHGET
jgi:periplasmic divalent cation tolerance protein